MAKDFEQYLAGLRAQSGGRAATEGESKRALPQRETRPQSEKERFPDYFNRAVEREGRSEWSGSKWGGRGR